MSGADPGADGSFVLAHLEHSIVIKADHSRVTRRVARSFREMATASSSDSSDLLEVRTDGARHSLRRNGAEVFSDSSLDEVQRVLRHEIIRSFVRRRRDLLWLHAGAAVLDEKAVLFVAPYARGKSTLVTELCARGWSYASDDIVPVDLPTGRILPFPLTPFVREAIGAELPGERIAELRKVRVSLPRTTFHRGAASIGAVVLPRFRAGSEAIFEDYRPAEVALDVLREVMNCEYHAEAAVALCTRLVSELPVLKLGYSNARTAADTIVERLSAPRRFSRPEGWLASPRIPPSEFSLRGGRLSDSAIAL